MADFSYIAIGKDGKQVKGTMQAADPMAVRSRLKLDGMTPVSVTNQSFLTKDIQIGGNGRVKTRDLSVFCRQFVSILNAGVTVVEALRMLAEQTENKALRKALMKTRELVQQGETLADAMEKSPNVFPEMFVNMVAAGEASGNLDVCVARMGTQFEKSAKLQGMVKRALIYPIAVLVIAIAVLIIMSIFVIPKFGDMYKDLGTELPLMTQAAVGFSNFLIYRWYILIGAVLILIILISWFSKTEAGKKFFGTLAIKLPIFGKINIKTNAASFARTMSTLVSSGMGITASIEITAKAMKNLVYERALKVAKADVEQGIPLSVPIRKSKVFPPMVHNMLAIGEETGSIEQMLDKVADYYEEESEIATASLTELMQPVIIVVLGALIGWLVLAMYQPLIGMYGSMGNL